MRTFDFSPLYRSTVGFDRMLSMLEQPDGVEDLSNYPPYNIGRTGENAYRISVAVAGFTDADLSIETKENRLAIRCRSVCGQGAVSSAQFWNPCKNGLRGGTSRAIHRIGCR